MARASAARQSTAPESVDWWHSSSGFAGIAVGVGVGGEGVGRDEVRDGVGDATHAESRAMTATATSRPSMTALLAQQPFRFIPCRTG